MTRERFAAAPKRGVFGLLGRICIALTIALAAPGVLVYLSGNDAALLLVIVGFGTFVTGIGLLAAARAAQ